MGANCCVASRNKALPDDSRFEVCTYRNVRNSPSWNFRWDNRTHIEDIMDVPSRNSHHSIGNIVSEIRSGTDTEIEGLSNGGSPLATLQKTMVKTKFFGKSKYKISDYSIGSNPSPEENEKIRTPGIETALETKPLIHLASDPSSSTFRLDASSSRSVSLPSVTAPSRSNDLSTVGSQGVSSDGWSIRTFTELVASSQRETCSLDKGNTVKPSNLSLPSLFNLQTCGLCSKLLKERDPWNTHRLAYTNELSATAVLACSHVYHAECLEGVTIETEKYEPPCPICTNGEKFALTLLEKAGLTTRSKNSRFTVAGIDTNYDHTPETQNDAGKETRMGASSSMKSSSGRPFLRRHFSIRSRSVSESTRKKGFWARHRKDLNEQML